MASLEVGKLQVCPQRTRTPVCHLDFSHRSGPLLRPGNQHHRIYEWRISHSPTNHLAVLIGLIDGLFGGQPLLVEGAVAAAAEDLASAMVMKNQRGCPATSPVAVAPSMTFPVGTHTGHCCKRNTGKLQCRERRHPKHGQPMGNKARKESKGTRGGERRHPRWRAKAPAAAGESTPKKDRRGQTHPRQTGRDSWAGLRAGTRPQGNARMARARQRPVQDIRCDGKDCKMTRQSPQVDVCRVADKNQDSLQTDSRGSDQTLTLESRQTLPTRFGQEERNTDCTSKADIASNPSTHPFQ